MNLSHKARALSDYPVPNFAVKLKRSRLILKLAELIQTSIQFMQLVR